jgi:protease IV
MSEILQQNTSQQGDKLIMPSTNETESKRVSDDENWERDIVNRLAFASLNEQRRRRRWRIFFMFLFFVYLFLIYATILESDWRNLIAVEDELILTSSQHTALVDLEGVIAANAQANADTIVSSLRRAFKDDNTAAVIIRINSPGGSPVQAGYIYDEIIRLRKKYSDIPIYAVISDICASGGYYIAAAADKIYADKASVVGSIGVLMNGFGFVEALKKLGIERRLLTAGEHKGFLDPYSPIKEEDVSHIQSLLEDIHAQFIKMVKQGREKSLKAQGKLELLDNPELFSGLVWTGEQALENGLVDGLGSSSYVAREIIQVEKIKDFTSKPNYLDRFAEHLGGAIANTISDNLKLNSATIE